LIGGASFSIAVFVGLSQLINVPFDPAPRVEPVRIDFTAKRTTYPAQSKRDPQVVRDPPIVAPERPNISFGNGADGVRGVTSARPVLEPIGRNDGIGMRGLDGDAMPIVRVQPEYPPGAITSGKEGWVRVRFSVTAAGTVRDAIVVASEPGTVFDEAALRAVARWRYNPRVTDGVAVERVGLETLLRFELE
jgi:protein TonB